MQVRRRQIAGLVVVVALVAAGVEIDRYFLDPRVDRPGHADAVIVLGGAATERVPVASELVRDGIAPVLVLSNPAGVNNEDAAKLCRRHPGVAVICFVPRPGDTRGEARAIGRLVEEHQWNRIVVVTSDYHVSRSRLLINPCTSARVELVASHSKLGVWSRIGRVSHEIGGYLVARTAERGC
jgi:uncharacterized SAM-binding protein YcdF (DUF218 family)